MQTYSDPHVCYFCHIEDTLETAKFRRIVEKHHIKEKNEGGRNDIGNIVPCCSTCHSKIHNGLIIIDRWYFSSKGKHVLHWFDELGHEHY